MNHVKVVNVIIYKLQTKQGSIIDIPNRNVLGWYYKYEAYIIPLAPNARLLTTEEVSIEVESESGFTEHGRTKCYETKDTSCSHVIPFHQSQAAALALLGNLQDLYQSRSQSPRCFGQRNGQRSLSLTKRIAASGNEIGFVWEKKRNISVSYEFKEI